MVGEREISFADHLDRLITTVHPAGRGPYTHDEVAEGIQEVGGPSVSPPYISQLRRGRRDNPSFALVAALARFFEVPLSYFAPDAEGALTEDDAVLLTAARNPEYKELLLKLDRLAPSTRVLVATLVDSLLGPGREESGESER